MSIATKADNIGPIAAKWATAKSRGRRPADCPQRRPLRGHNDNRLDPRATGHYDPARVYRYLGGTQWEDCGQPSVNPTLNCIASYKGKLYVGGGSKQFGVFEYEGGTDWQPSKLFSDREVPSGCFPHSMCRHNGKLFVAYPGAYCFDGKTWTSAGLPSDQDWFLQTHSMTIFQGKLCAGTWPESKVSIL